jgi:hypothetical protein
MGFALQSDVERLRASIDRLEIAYCFTPLTPKSFAKYTKLSFIIQPAKGKGDRVQALQHIPKTVILIDCRNKTRTVTKLIRRRLQLRHLRITACDLSMAVNCRAASCASCVIRASLACITFCIGVILRFGSTGTLFCLLIASPSTWDRLERCGAVKRPVLRSGGQWHGQPCVDFDLVPVPRPVSCELIEYLGVYVESSLMCQRLDVFHHVVVV